MANSERYGKGSEGSCDQNAVQYFMLIRLSFVDAYYGV